jgi:hypothetical protein
MSHIIFRRTFFRIIGIMIILNYCSPNHVAQPGFPTAPPQEQIEPSLQDKWMPEQVPGTRQYLIEDSSTTFINDDPTHTSLLQTATTYSLSLISLADSFSFTAKVDSISTSSASFPGASTVNKSFSQTVHGTLSNSGEMSAVITDASSSCQEGVDAAGMRVFELTQYYPKRAIKIGDKWADTISATSCRGKIMLHQEIIREYQLLELTNWKEHAVAKIQRNVSTRATGTSSESQNYLTATGFGAGTVIFYADRTKGFLRESNSHSESKFIITTSRGNYSFTQNIITHIKIQ